MVMSNVSRTQASLLQFLLQWWALKQPDWCSVTLLSYCRFPQFSFVVSSRALSSNNNVVSCLLSLKYDPLFNLKITYWICILSLVFSLPFLLLTPSPLNFFKTYVCVFNIYVFIYSFNNLVKTLLGQLKELFLL